MAGEHINQAFHRIIESSKLGKTSDPAINPALPHPPLRCVPKDGDSTTSLGRQFLCLVSSFESSQMKIIKKGS